MLQLDSLQGQTGPHHLALGAASQGDLGQPDALVAGGAGAGRIAAFFAVRSLHVQQAGAAAAVVLGGRLGFSSLDTAAVNVQSLFFPRGQSVLVVDVAVSGPSVRSNIDVCHILVCKRGGAVRGVL